MSWGALATLCVSCLPLLLSSVVALGAILGIGTVRLVETPWDPILNILEIPLFLVSMAVIGWTTWKGPRPAFGLAMGGGALVLLGLLTMPHAGAEADAGHEASDHGAGSVSWGASMVLSILAFSVGAGMVLAGIIWQWRHGRRRRGTA